jgi:hypothetical protein
LALSPALVGLSLTLGTGCGGASSAPSPATAEVAAPPRGYAVLAHPDASASAWPLAQGAYRSARLRPHLDEARARVLAGSPPDRDRKDLRDLADTRDAISDDGAPSRTLLRTLAQELGLEGVIVVTIEPTPPRAPGAEPAPDEPAKVAKARLFERSTGQFSPITIEGSGAAWEGAIASLERLVPRAAPVPPPASAGDAKVAEKGGGGRAFYESPWFWGAAGAAVVLGGAFFLATRDSSSDSIHVQMQVPR